MFAVETPGKTAKLGLQSAIMDVKPKKMGYTTHKNVRI
jgi:hypothetical protein